jgi:hypothetical protein
VLDIAGGESRDGSCGGIGAPQAGTADRSGGETTLMGWMVAVEWTVEHAVQHQ